MKIINICFLSAVALSATPALAADRSVTLAVDNLSCVTCVPTVKKSLSNVPGVKRVDVSAKARSATVVFDDKATTVAALISATTNAGYPSRPKL
ncbi:Mercuric transport protein periplasmic component precursor [Sphingopyxis sp. LC81]|uniref:cation transporter n=1 Tax=unclassified Sphingopyxis TaxID=2614943 RepID=UPI00050F7022|nr:MULTISPECIES: cation transporter [unclassified Sphingopyxis]KGB53547.1 Mercuric transport protein periplasmic component precursor [Sphingopyxis sp. LC81]MDT7531287.1 cation transporter [Sphingopyxis sp. SE2]